MPSGILEQSNDQENSDHISKKIDDFLYSFIQKREFAILMNNDFNLHSQNGLDVLTMILKLSNPDFEFGPLISAIEELIFSN